MGKFFLKQSLNEGLGLKGEIEGIAYSGKVIKDFCGFNNFIIDLATLSIAKPKNPLLKDHLPELVVGHVSVENDLEQLTMTGKISARTATGKEILDLAEDGVDWELSVGVYDGMVEEGFSGEVNGYEVQNATVVRNGVLREVSVVALGADSNTKTVIMSNKQENKMNEKQYKKLLKTLRLAENAEVDEVIEKVEEFVEQITEADQEAVDKDALIEELKAQIEELKAQLDAIAEEAEAEQREEEVEASLKEKGISLSKEKIKEISRTKEGFDVFMSAISEIKVQNKIDSKFSKKVDLGKAEDDNNTLNMRDAANKMVKEGKAKNFTEALLKLNKKSGE